MTSSFTIDIPPFFDESSRGDRIDLSEEILHAIIEVFRGRKIFHIASQVDLEEMRCRFDKSPDTRVLSNWILKRELATNELGVMFWLSAMVRSEWEALPRITQSQHRELYGKIARSCGELSDLLHQTGSEYRRGGGWGMMHPRVLDLLTESEMSKVELYEKYVEGAEPHQRLSFALPTVDMLLGRLKEAAIRLADNGAIHSQPKKKGAVRGYFVRRIGELFRQRYDECPTEVIAALTTLALDEVTDRELVSKLLKEVNVIGKN